jgi:hypothetical protein
MEQQFRATGVADTEAHIRAAGQTEVVKMS